MVIRSEQIAELQRSRDADYKQEVFAIVRTELPHLAAALDDSSLRVRIADALPAARSYGIRTPEGILAYIGLSLVAGPAFHTDASIRAALTVQGGDPDTTIGRIMRGVSESLQHILKTSAEGHGPFPRRTS